MLQKLKLTCFRQHTDLEINFTPGLNAIRGSNEAGKSTVLLAISYAFFGSAALSQPLEDIVTYDVPVSKLRVELDFEHAGVNYHIYRGKSGAELTFGNETVTGQTEVTKFIERLFGATSKLANKLMIARQKELSGILDEGPTAVGGLIETLANFELLDEIIDAVNSDLPSGNTKSLEGRIEGLQTATGESQLEDLSELANSAEGAEFCAKSQEQAVAILAAQISSKLLAEANDTITQDRILNTRLADLKRQVEVQQGQLAKQLDTVCPTDERIAELDRAVNDVANATHLHNLYKRFISGNNFEPMWDGDIESLNAEHANTQKTINDLKTKISNLQVQKQKHTGQLIKETTCAFCDKDLTDVPEVLTRNTELGKLIDKAEADIKESQAALDASLDYLAQLASVTAQHQKVQLFYAGFGNHITVTTNVVPHQATWPNVPSAPGEDLSKVLAEAKRTKLEHTGLAAVKAHATKELEQLTLDIGKVSDQLAQLDVPQAKSIIDQQGLLVQQHKAESVKLTDMQRIAQEAKHALQLAEARNGQIIENAKRAAEDLAKAQAELAEMQANNALIKKLREARPQITNQIWGMTLHSVTTYFSDIRGFKSVVTKDESGFKVNAQSAKGLSGSAEDALGLAIRTSLVKTFLPNTNFIILDEMAAACDANREAAMLGMIAKCGFPQVLMVTHSDQCDAYADNMIRLGE